MSFLHVFAWRHTLLLVTKQLLQAISAQVQLFWKCHLWWFCCSRRTKVADVIFVSAQERLKSGWPNVLAVLHTGIADHSAKPCTGARIKSFARDLLPSWHQPIFNTWERTSN